MVMLTKGNSKFIEFHFDDSLKRLRQVNYNKWKWLYVVNKGNGVFELHASKTRPDRQFSSTIIEIEKI